jgi:DNA-binding MarR family transcriptional regulator
MPHENTNAEESEAAARVQARAVVSSCTSLSLRKAARAASQFLAAYLAPLGLRAGQFGILSHISQAGATTMTRLAEALVTDRTTLTRNLRLLQRDGLVEIAPGQDRRVRLITLTERGRRVFADAVPLWEQAESALRARLGAERCAALLAQAAAVAALAEKPTV